MIYDWILSGCMIGFKWVLLGSIWFYWALSGLMGFSWLKNMEELEIYSESAKNEWTDGDRYQQDPAAK